MGTDKRAKEERQRVHVAVLWQAKPSKLLGEDSHLLNFCTQITTRSSDGCVGTGISCSSSFAVGIQNDSLPFSTRVAAAKARISSSMAKKLYGFFGGTKSGELVKLVKYWQLILRVEAQQSLNWALVSTFHRLTQHFSCLLQQARVSLQGPGDQELLNLPARRTVDRRQCRPIFFYPS